MDKTKGALFSELGKGYAVGGASFECICHSTIQIQSPNTEM